MIEEITYLREENNKLLNASKMWWEKYVQMLNTEEGSINSMYLTPMKMSSKTTEIDDKLIEL
jgi:hypothetical protein